MKLVFLLEEESMREALKGVLPRLLPGVEYELIPHRGIPDLERSIPRKLRGWKEPGVRFVVVRDQERHPDCTAIKTRITDLCSKAGKPETLVRIVCRGLEAWFLADLLAVETGLGVKHLAKHQATKDCKAPDNVIAPAEALKRLTPKYQKRAGARAIGPHLNLDNTRSPSFKAFVQGVRRLAAE